jgi:hypothetical protein
MGFQRRVFVDGRDMKVPIYQNKVPLSPTSGAGQLSVQANPQAMSAGSRAQAQFGQTLVAGGINWYSDFVKLERAQEQATETTKFDNFLAELTSRNMRTRPSDWQNKNKLGPDGKPTLYKYFEYEKVIRDQLQKKSQEMLGGIESGAVKKRLTAVHAQRINAALVSINATNRGKYVDFSKDQLKSFMLRETDAISNMEDGIDKNQAIEDSIASFRGFKEARPLMGDAYFGNAERNFLSDIGELSIAREMAKITTADGAAELKRQLDDPKKSDPRYADVKRLLPEKKQQFITRLAARQTALESKEFNQPLKNIKRTKAIKKNNAELTHDALSQNITAIRDAVSNGHELGDDEWPKNKEGQDLEMPDPSDIYLNDKITTAQKVSLNKEIEGEDVIFNRAEFRVLQGEIGDAVTSQDLDTLLADIRMKKENNYIGGKAFDGLRKEIRDARNKTPEFEERKRYKDLLKLAMDKRNLDIQTYARPGANQKQKVEAGFASSAGIAFYLDQLDEGKQPAEAFWTTVTTLQKNKIDMVKSTVATMGGVFSQEILDDPAKNLNLGAINKARAALRTAVITGGRLESGNITIRETGDLPTQSTMAEMQKERGDDKLPKAERMTIRKLYAAEQKLNFLQSYAALPDEERGVSKVPAAGDPGMSTTNKTKGNNFTDKAGKFFNDTWDEIFK